MDWLIWQLADSAFPSGGFAHSNGLEAAWQQGEVDGAEGLEQFLRDAIVQAGYAALPLIHAAHERPGDLAELDALCDAFLTNIVANRSSRIQGQAFLLATERAFPATALCEIVRAENLAPHYAPLFGAVGAALGLPRRSTQALFLHLTCRSVLAAAVRLGLIGSNAAQHLQAAMAPHLDDTMELCAGLSTADLAQTAPLNDLWQSMHDRIYSRLFQS